MVYLGKFTPVLLLLVLIIISYMVLWNMGCARWLHTDRPMKILMLLIFSLVY